MNPRRGAARISVVWMIACIVVALASIGIAAIAYQDLADADLERENAIAQRDSEQALALEADSGHSALTRAVGWYDESNTRSRTDTDALQSALDETKQTFGLGDDVKTLEDLLPLVRQAYLNQTQEISTLEGTIAQLETEKQAIQTQMATSLADKDSTISNLRSDLQDAADSAATKQSELEQRVADLRDRNNTLDAEKRQLESDLDTAQRDYDAQRQALMVRLDTQARKLNFVEKSAESPDGSVLEFSKDLSLGWIDIGARQRVAPGIRFRIQGGSRGEFKGWATVTNVEATMAEVQVSGMPDRFNPVTPGDKLFNPLFDPKGERYAVLAGRFSGEVNEKELRVLLDNMNIKVEDELSELTDFLIVGSEMWTDPVTKEPLEDPLPPDELPVYKDAQARGGISIIPLKDIRKYFRF